MSCLGTLMYMLMCWFLADSVGDAFGKKIGVIVWFTAGLLYWLVDSVCDAIKSKKEQTGS